MPDHFNHSRDDRGNPVRQRFLASSHTLENVRRDFPEWHRGRAHYLLWAIDVDAVAVRERVAGASAHLADLLLDGYRRGPHVTLALCGFASAASENMRFDEVGVAYIEAQAAALRLARVPSFAIDIGALDSF